MHSAIAPERGNGGPEILNTTYGMKSSLEAPTSPFLEYEKKQTHIFPPKGSDTI
jgi:hypothetical protein